MTMNVISIKIFSCYGSHEVLRYLISKFDLGKTDNTPEYKTYRFLLQ